MRKSIVLFLLASLLPLQLPASEEPESIRAWRDFTSQLEAAGVEVLKNYPQPQAIDQAEGLHYLMQQLADALNRTVLDGPSQISLLRVGATTINKWGMDGADAKYQGANIDGNGEYRLYGTLGSARLFALQLARMEGIYKGFASLTGDQLQADEAGNFELLISAKKPSHWQGAWMELDNEIDHLLIREYFSDWDNERPGSYYIERLDSAPAGAPITMQASIKQLDKSVSTFSSRVPQWVDRVQKTRNHLVNKAFVQQADEQGLAANAYGSGWFKVAEDEALIVEMDDPGALLWSVQLGNVWWESLDYINHTASYNDSQAVASGDGKFRFVLSHKDPGLANWLDPAGHSEGMILFRIQQGEHLVNPVMTLVPLAELAQHLPKETATVNASQRQAGIEARRRHAAVRWAP